LGNNLGARIWCGLGKGGRGGEVYRLTPKKPRESRLVMHQGGLRRSKVRIGLWWTFEKKKGSATEVLQRASPMGSQMPENTRRKKR